MWVGVCVMTDGEGGEAHTVVHTVVAARSTLDSHSTRSAREGPRGRQDRARLQSQVGRSERRERPEQTDTDSTCARGQMRES